MDDTKLKITSLTELENWNLNPTKEKPIVMEWYYNWIFDVINEDKYIFGWIDKSNFKKFKHAYKTHVEFSMICEGYSLKEALKICKDNIRYVYDRFSKRCPKFWKYMEKLQREKYGFSCVDDSKLVTYIN